MIYKKIDLLLLAVLMVLCIIMPNVAKELCAVTIFVLAAKYVKDFSLRIFNEKYFIYLTFSSLVTIGYVIVGLVNGAPVEAAIQVIYIYIISIFLWGIVIIGILKKYHIKKICYALLLCLFFSILSQAYYFIAFTKYGPESVAFLIEKPNVEISDEGYAGASMYVFGSMIFLIGGLISSPGVVKSKFLMITLICASLLAAFTSGRSMLVLSIFLGLLMYLLNSIINKKIFMVLVGKFLYFSFFLLGFAILISVFYEYTNINLLSNLNALIDKVASGGEGRDRQSYMLVEGIFEYFGLGAGHGIGVTTYISSDKFPWRYETIWLASIYRVGILGATIYVYPFIVVLLSAGKSLIKGKLNPSERFIYGGFFCSFIASTTNPYIEGFVFQWMYIFPIVYFTASSWIKKDD